jgi:hypothetical protein
MSQHTSIDAAILAVMEAVPYVQKTGKISIPGRPTYSYPGEADLLAAIRPAMLANGLTLIPVEMQVDFHEQYASKSGTMNRVVVRATYRLGHTSGHSLTVMAMGEGADVGDKATAKAMTSAMKYALRQTFVVETGDDPDKTPSVHQKRSAPSADAFAAARSKVGTAPSLAALTAYRAKYTTRGYSREQVAELDALAEERRSELIDRVPVTA